MPAAALALLAGCASQDFADTRHWVLESEKAATVTARDGVLDIDTPAGLTLWFKPKLEGPVEIEFEAMAISRGGPNDQVSDLNVFWMARNPDGVEPVYAKIRSGAFAEYDDLLAYYVGLGGNRNTTTRFRRYIGEPGTRPLLPEHDLSAPEFLLAANRPTKIRLVADGRRIEYWLGGT